MPSLPLSFVIRIEDPLQYKLHVARWNGHEQPLDVYLRDKDEWFAWNEYGEEKDEFDREYVFSIIDVYHETDSWLFGGIFRVIRRDATPHAFNYVVEEIPDYSELVGRLKIRMPRPPRGRAYRLERLLPSMEVAEVLSVPYSGNGPCSDP